MSKLNTSLRLKSSVEDLIQVFLDAEKWSSFLPKQLKDVKILEKTANEITTEETFVFKTLVKNEIKQTTIHKKLSDNSIKSRIISGHAKGTEIDILFQEIENGTEVFIDIDLKLSLKAKFLGPLIKKYYMVALRGILMKIDFSILDAVNSSNENRPQMIVKKILDIDDFKFDNNTFNLIAKTMRLEMGGASGILTSIFFEELSNLKLNKNEVSLIPIFENTVLKIKKREVVVIEPSPFMAKECRKKKLKVIQKFLEFVKKEDLSKDKKFFTCFELFEHLHNPSKFIKYQ